MAAATLSQQGSQTWPQGQPWQQPGYGQQPYMPPQQQPPPKKRHWVRNTFLGLAGFIVLIVIIAIAANGGSNGTPAAGGGAAPANAAPANAAPAAPQIAKIGTPVRDGKFQFTITSVSHAKSVGDTADGLGDTAQGNYTILHVTVTKAVKAELHDSVFSGGVTVNLS